MDAPASTLGELGDQIRAFDLVAFRGGDAVSKLILALEGLGSGNSEFSHIGMVVTSEVLPSYEHKGALRALAPGRRYLLESTFSYKNPFYDGGPSDVFAGAGKFGVQLRELDDVVLHYLADPEARVAWCKLADNPLDRRDGPELVQEFGRVFSKYYDRRYEMDFVGLLGAVVPSLRFLRDARDAAYDSLWHAFGASVRSPGGWQFCSELVANVLRDLGVIPPDADPKDVLPVDLVGHDQDGVPALVSEIVYLSAGAGA